MYTISKIVEVFNMQSPWFFIHVPAEYIPPVKRRGWGSIPIIATIGKTTWHTSIFPMNRNYYFIPLKKLVRDKENIAHGDTITISYTVEAR